MRHKIIFFIVATILIPISVCVYGQKVVPIKVETLDTTPTTVITGQALKQVYIIKFIDLSHLGEEIIIEEEALDQKFLGDFDVLSFEIDRETKQGQFLENWWYLNYTLRVINPKKGPQVIPSFTIPWKHKKSGQERNDPGIEIDYGLKTEEVNLNYVTTIPEKITSLAIRDRIDFGIFRTRGLVFYIASWILLIFPLGFWLAVFVRRFRHSSDVNSPEKENVKIEEVFLVDSKNTKISLWKARKNLRKYIRKLKRMGSHSGEFSFDAPGIMPGLYGALMDFLRITIPHSTIGTTGVEMLDLVKKMKNGFKNESVRRLAERAACYQNHIEESGKINYFWPTDPVDDAKSLNSSLRRTGRLSILIGPAHFIKNFFKKIFNRGK
ncbi:MAG: hypothetical protein COV30_02225 [Candidatus Yanofskybacteria bacterium CG10_big_fil_rev_8_21_14_0_10_37_15]|uniref:Uncharacterized protein n=1 Tax=Candidatus Yanofskybacteria bacterium CG10_big_fil_rev_8_21_14_0_10_37_15 TaxID=1975097 RepID=A0A2H0R5C1_9BACT|nr:MAG: hypothetical protein COV30_02225 [Candidatus Yanofskybacteria bacterium CG10_big_fil_rev_8_21_14_0_10_37_15]